MNAPKKRYFCDIKTFGSETLFSRLVNNREALNILIEELHSLKQIDKEYIIKLMKNLSKRNPNRFEEKAN